MRGRMLKTISNSRYMQYFAAIAAALSSAASSAYLVWPSPTLPILQSERTPLDRVITNDEASWVVSIYLLAAIPGAFLGGWLVEKIGRRRTLLTVALFLFVPWMIIIFAKKIEILYVARAIAGVGGGFLIIACAVYNGEIAENDIRGKLGTTFIALKLVGHLVVLSVGPYVSYTWLAIICSTLPIIFFSAFIFMPETPHYLLKIGNHDGARKSLIALSSNASDEKSIDRKLMEILETVQNDMMHKTTVWEFFSKKEYRKSIFVMAGIKTLQNFSGMAAIEAYMQSIISMTNSDISPAHSSIIFGVVQLPSVLVASFLVDKLGRKPLIVISAFGSAVALFGEGAYFFIQDYLQGDVTSIAWLPTTALALYMIISSLGVISLPYVLLGELFPTNIKGIAVSSATIYGTTIAFVVSKLFDPISRTLGIYAVFWIFGSSCLLGSVLVLFFLPETKGKSFADIQNKLNGRTKETIVKNES